MAAARHLTISSFQEKFVATSRFRVPGTVAAAGHPSYFSCAFSLPFQKEILVFRTLLSDLEKQFALQTFISFRGSLGGPQSAPSTIATSYLNQACHSFA